MGIITTQKKMRKYFFIAALLMVAGTTNAQQDTTQKIPTFNIGVFAPLYLDSVFTNGNFSHKAMPKFIVPAVDFVQGAMLALDSLKLGNENVKLFVYDTKARTQNISWLVKTRKIDSLHLIIGSVRDVDYKQLSDVAVAKKIPFISATYPNDGGITANPYTVILTSTLKAHCEAIYSYLLQNHGTDNIYFCRKKGQQEDRVAGYFKSLNEQDGRALLNIQTLNTDSNFTSAVLQNKLDSNRKNIIIGGSLDETFAKNISIACKNLTPTYNVTLIGMPNWDGFSSLRKKGEFEEFPIYYTTSYYNGKWDAYSKMLTAGYQKKYRIKPSDLAFKGFEAVYYFTRLLIKNPTSLMEHVNDKSAKVYSDFNIRPVKYARESATPDYFENKHLYFIKILDGKLSRAW
jgi:ABC-type branched-subunit amino acid transport system substrate-binding protein